MQPTRATSPGGFARSFWYPSSYVNLNANSDQKSAVTERVFWDEGPDVE